MLRCHYQKMVHCLQQLQHFPCAVSFVLVASDGMSKDFDVLDVFVNGEDDIAFAKQHLVGVDLGAVRVELLKLRTQLLLVAMQSGGMALGDLRHLMGMEVAEVGGWICAV